MSDGDRDSLDIAVLFDAPEENWPSMDLAGEMLIEQWRANASFKVAATKVSISIPAMVRRIAGAGSRTFNADRAIARYLAYPLRALAARRPGRLFHVVDHSYAHLVHALPGSRAGVYCHDLDVFRPLLTLREDSTSFLQALARVLRRGLQAAAVVFHSTREVGRALEERRLVPRSRLVLAPYGVAPEFNEHADPNDGTEAALSSIPGRPFILHVGSEIARKRLDVLFEVFARLLANHPELRLVQQGATLTSLQRAHVERLGIGHALVQPPKLGRIALAGLYRRASVVVITSEAEGFGLPLIEAMASGAVVVASDLPILREVGGEAALYAPVADVPAWTARVGALFDRPDIAPPKAARIARAAAFTWQEHARTLRDAYFDIATRGGAPTGLNAR